MMRGLRCAVIGVGATAMAAAVGAAPAAARPYDEIIASGVISIAVYREFAPFADENDGDPIGIDIDIGRAIARALGVAPQFMFFTADESVDDDLRNAIWRGSLFDRVVADLMLHVPYDRRLDIRNERVALYAPYLRHRIVIAQNPDMVGSDAPLEALQGHTVGVELDSLSDFFLLSAHGGVLRETMEHFPTTTAAALALRNETVAAVMGPESHIQAALGDRLDAFEVYPAELRPLGMSTWTVGIAVREDSRDLGYAVEDIFAELVESGAMQRIFADHGVTWRTPGWD